MQNPRWLFQLMEVLGGCLDALQQAQLAASSQVFQQSLKQRVTGVRSDDRQCIIHLGKQSADTSHLSIEMKGDLLGLQTPRLARRKITPDQKATSSTQSALLGLQAASGSKSAKRRIADIDEAAPMSRVAETAGRRPMLGGLHHQYARIWFAVGAGDYCGVIAIECWICRAYHPLT